MQHLRVPACAIAAVLMCAAAISAPVSPARSEVTFRVRGGEAEEWLPVTTLWLSNTSPGPALVTYSFTPAGNADVRTFSETIPPGATIYRADAVGELFQGAGTGSLRIVSEPGGGGGIRRLGGRRGGQEPTGAVWALLKIDGQWQAPDDWTKEPRKDFCRDKSTEDLQELVVIISNSDTNRGHVLAAGNPTVYASGIGCTDWTGTATAVHPNGFGPRDRSPSSPSPTPPPTSAPGATTTTTWPQAL